MSTLTDQVADFLDEKRRAPSVATHRQYAFVMERIFLPWADKERITEARQVTDKVLYRLQDNLKERRRPQGDPLSPATLRTYIRHVRIFLKWANVPRGRYQIPKSPQRLRDVVSRQEIDTMEKAAADERDRLIVRLLADTGIRLSELLGLRPRDLRENSHDREKFIHVIGKGDKEREVSVPTVLFQRLQTFAEFTEPTERIFQSRRRRGGEYQPLTPSGVDQLIRQLAKQAKITKRVYPHLFRHAYVTHMLKRNVNPVLIQKAVGHTTLAMISETYSHLHPADSWDTLTRALKD